MSSVVENHTQRFSAFALQATRRAFSHLASNLPTINDVHSCSYTVICSDIVVTYTSITLPVCKCVRILYTCNIHVVKHKINGFVIHCNVIKL